MELEVFLNGSVATEVAGGQDLDAFAGEFAGWVAAPVEESREFHPEDVERLLILMKKDASTATVIGFSEFPYTDGGKLQGPTREIEREYWLQLTNVDKRIGKHDNMAILHVHYKDKWRHPRQRTTISQMNLRHTVPAEGSGARPSNAYWDKCVDLGKWREMRGKMMFKIPPGGWNWQHKPAFCPEMHALLVAAEQCTQKVRSFSLEAPSERAAAASGRRRALILAAETYTCPALQGLVNVDNDANNLKQTLQRLGWVADVERNGSLEDVKRSIEGFAASVAGSGEACLLAFIGHGVEVGGNIFLVPSDAELSGSRVEERDWARFLRFADVQAVFATHRGGAPLDSEATVFLLDCCRSGLSVDAQAPGALIEPGRTKVPNSIVIFSTSSGDTAGDGRAGEGGPWMNIFTEELLQNPGRDVVHVTITTRGRLLSAQFQLAQDELALTASLVINQLPAANVADASLGGAPRPAKTAAACTFRVNKEVLASSQVREEEMGKLRRWVENEAPGRMLVCGVGGAGKTTLARMFAARAAAEGLQEAVFFLSMSDGNCSEEYVELAKKLEVGANVQALQKMSEEKLRAHVHGLLSSDEWEGRWLLVLDDLPDPGDEGISWVARDFPFGSGKTLATSRSQGWIEEGGAGNWGKLALEGMAEAEACAWVLRQVEAWAGEQAGVLELVRKLGCLPLAIEQAAAFAREYSIETPALYLAEQAKSSSKLRVQWEKRRKRDGEYAFSFAEVISLTFGRLIEADDDDSIGAIDLLRKMAFLHSDGIQKDLFQDTEWMHVIALKRHSLVVDSPLGGVSMHALTQEVVRELLMGGSKATALGGVLETLNAKMSKFSFDRPVTYFVGKRYVRHVKAAASHALDCPVRQATVLASLCQLAGFFLSTVSCSFAEALEMLEVSLGANVRAYAPDHVEVAKSYNNIANIHQVQGKLVEALELYEKSKAIKINALGHDHVDVAKSYTNIANIYQTQDKLVEALELFEKSLAITIKALGHDHVDVAKPLNSIAIIYQKQGKLVEALELFEKSLAIKIKALGHDHVDVAMSYNNIANMYQTQGKLVEALELYEKSKAIKINALGHDHVDVAMSYHNIAIIYQTQGKLVEALELYEKSKAIRIKVLGHDHVNVATPYHNIATIYQTQGKLVEALEQYEKSLAITIKALGHDHVDVAKPLNSIAIIYQKQGKLVEALELYEKSNAITIKALGHDHLDVAITKYNLAACREEQGELVRAGGLFRESAAIYSKVLGAEHEETLHALKWARRCEQRAA